MNVSDHLSISNTYVDPVLRAEDAAVDAMLCAGGGGAAAVRAESSHPAASPPGHRPLHQLSTQENISPPAPAPALLPPRRRVLGGHCECKVHQ